MIFVPEWHELFVAEIGPLANAAHLHRPGCAFSLRPVVVKRSRFRYEVARDVTDELFEWTLDCVAILDAREAKGNGGPNRRVTLANRRARRDVVVIHEETDLLATRAPQDRNDSIADPFAQERRIAADFIEQEVEEFLHRT